MQRSCIGFGFAEYPKTIITSTLNSFNDFEKLIEESTIVGGKYTRRKLQGI